MPKVLAPTPSDVEKFGVPEDAPPGDVRTPVITLLAAQLFPTPIPMGSLYNSIVVLPRFSLNPNNGSTLSAQLTLVQLAAMLTAFKTGLGSAKVALFTNNVTPNPQLIWSALTEPTGTWYAEVATTLGAVQVFPDGNIGLVGSSAEWDYTGSSASQNIVGWALVNSVGT